MAERMAARANTSGATGTKAKSAKAKAKAAPKRKTKTGSRPPAETFGKKTIALVYDFDGTLSPKPMQEYAFLPTIGESSADFWKESNRIASEQKADPMITYMHLLYKKAKARNVTINREALVKQGAAVEFFPGVEQWFDLINNYIAASPDSDGVSIRHYLISSGLTEIVEGTSIYSNFHNVFASEYWFEAYELPYPKRVITDTGKTQYLFRINKGVEDLGASINEHMPEAQRPVPFSNMIYFGDGDTDVPSMAVTRKNGGYAMAVHPPGKAQEKCTKLFEAGRCDFFAVADYREGEELYKRTCLLLDRMLADIRVREEMWNLTHG
ncbi:MAG: hypothetical protein ACI89J_004685 [Hyphomicrobiaceae bacterium]|jgi:hypothetical protein